MSNGIDTSDYKGQSVAGGILSGLLVGVAGSTTALELFPKDTIIDITKGTIKTVPKGPKWASYAAYAGVAAFTAVSTWIGYRVAKNGKDQFEVMKPELDLQTARADALAIQVEGLNQEVATHRKSFAELHAKHEEHASHAAQHPYRAEHGSHAEAALHEKHEAEAAEHAM